MKNSFDIVCIGSTSQDIFFPTDEAVIIETPEDLTSKVKIAFELGGKYRVADRYEAVGGVAANVAQGLAKLGCKAACYSKVGEDSVGLWIREELEKADVPLDCLFTDASVKTDLSAIVVLTQNGERTIFHNRDANEKLEILTEKLPESRWLFVSALNGDWQANLKKILALKSERKARLAFNPGQHNIKQEPEAVRQAIAEADILLLNKDEALELLLEGRDGEAALDSDEAFLLTELQKLKTKGGLIIGLTDGKRGAWASDGAAIWHCESPAPITPVDTTGAGDAFTSAFFGSCVAGLSAEEALRRGVANARSVLGFYGASRGLLDESALAAAAKERPALKLS